MASVGEIDASRRGNSLFEERQFKALGYSTKSSAITAVHADSDAPTSIGDLDRLDDETEAQEFSEGNWDVSVRWKLFEPTTGPNYSFEIGGTSIFRSHSIATSNSYANAGDTAPDFNNAIGWDGERVNGVQLPPQPGFTFTIPARKDVADVDTAYITAVSELLYTTNDDTFEGFAAGEVLFLGVSGSRVGDDQWQLYYKFAREDNLTGLSIDTITSIDKEGWEYLWVYYEPEEDGTANVLAVKPKAVYVEQVFEEGDFDGLEL